MPTTADTEGRDLEGGTRLPDTPPSPVNNIQRTASATSVVSDTANEETPLLAKAAATVHVDPEVIKWVGILLCLVLLVGGGVSMGMYVEGWRFLTALYVVVQLITTIGYGDFEIKHDSMRLFVCFMVLGCLVVLAFLSNILMETMAQKQFDRLAEEIEAVHMNIRNSATGSQSAASYSSQGSDDDATPRHSDDRKKKLHKVVNLLIATVPAMTDITFGTIFYGTYEACACGYGRTEIPGCREDDYKTCVETGGHVKTYLTAFYMAVITLTTVGIGDFSPRTKLGRAVAIPWILIGVASMAHWLKELAAFFFETEMGRKQLDSEVDKKTFDEIDKDGSGTLSRAEYRGFILVKHGFVSQDLLDKIDLNYDKLDPNGDEEVTFDMIQKAQKRKKTQKLQ